jgi:hypothetical protein
MHRKRDRAPTRAMANRVLGNPPLRMIPPRPILSDIFDARRLQEIAIAAAAFLRQKAQECGELIAKATNPLVIAQLEVWAREFEAEAKAALAAALTMLIVTPSKEGSA